MAAPTLRQVKGRSWLIPGPTNLGVVLGGEARDAGARDEGGKAAASGGNDEGGEDGVYLIDSGNDKEAGRVIGKLLREKGWKLTAIVNTHSNADHIGGNRYLQENTGCGIWATAGETGFITTPEIEGALLWGGRPYRELRSKFFEARPSKVTETIEAGGTRDGMTFVPLRGHFLDMVGVLSGDGVFYMGDGIFGERVLEKHKIPYIYDVQAYRESLARIGATEAAFYVPSHGEVLEEVGPLVAANLRRVDEIEGTLLDLLRVQASFEDLLAGLASAWSLSLDAGQYVLVGNTLRSFLSYFQDAGRAAFTIEGNRMTWSAAGGDADRIVTIPAADDGTGASTWNS
jgi:glyoxylase-like metal-dependent hydrolase (beta-lactamase superfamily II)